VKITLLIPTVNTEIKDTVTAAYLQMVFTDLKAENAEPYRRISNRKTGNAS
jgi:hypothetical protein